MSQRPESPLPESPLPESLWPESPLPVSSAEPSFEWVMGLMSGTSMDGIDVALIRTDGKSIAAWGPCHFLAYDDTEQALLRSSLKGRANVNQAADLVTRKHAEAVKALVKIAAKENIQPALIGFHGQTIDHRPDIGETWQIGDGAALAEICQLPVVWDFRSEDMRQGGQGAPLVPVYHRALGAGFSDAQVFVNIGGVANVTFIGKNQDLLAFDTGPGNALMDDLVYRHLGQSHDKNGEIARTGVMNETTLQYMMAHDFFQERPPKSLDRNSFDVNAWLGNDLADNLATLAAFTAETIAQSRQFMPETPQRWVICGGGRLNSHLMNLLQARLTGEVVSAEDVMLRGDSVEAEAFALLAACVKHGYATSYPETTGCKRPVSGGIISFPQ